MESDFFLEPTWKSSEEVLGGSWVHGESNPGDSRIGESGSDQDGSVDDVHTGSFPSELQDHNSDPANTMNAIYTAILVASTLAYSAVAWIGLSMDPTATEDLF
ncbi:unnamed protein product [Caenorhabditis nigoni]